MKRCHLIFQCVLLCTILESSLSAQQPGGAKPGGAGIPAGAFQADAPDAIAGELVAQPADAPAPALAPPPAPATAPPETIETQTPPNMDEVFEAPRTKPRRPRRPSRPAKEAVAIAGKLFIPEGQTNGDTTVILGQVEVLGTIRGDLIVVAGAVHLGPHALVTGETTVIASSLDADPSAILRGEQNIIGTDTLFSGLPWAGEWVRHGILSGRPFPPAIWWSWLATALFFLLYLALAYLCPRSVQSTVNSLTERPGGSALAGALALLALGPLLLLLIVMIVGLPLIPVVMCALLVALIFGKIAVLRYVGEKVGIQAGLPFLQGPHIALLVGAGVFCLLYVIPIVGLVAWGMAATVGLGAVLLTVFQRRHPSLSEPVNVVLPAMPGAATMSLPRVGFWMRFVATLLDLILVWLIVVFVLHRPGFFLPCWTVYHLILWCWKGTTLGGIILGLKIVRLDNRPVTISVAFVRLLGSFFSAAVLGLGFLWAGWTASKQSWHDKIAGTVIVKFPAGTSLV